MDANKMPYMLYAVTEGERVLIDLETIPTELLLPIKNAIPTELWRRSERTTFKADHDALNLAIEPKQMTLFEKKII